MRLLPCLLLAALLTPALAGAVTPVIQVINDANLPVAQLQRLDRDYRRWAERVYRYNHVTDPAPVKLVFTHDVHIGIYVDETISVPPDDEDEMLETWVHELAHHATGHDSSFFFKEGIATNTLEALFVEDGKMPQGWPQYGQSNDAWVSLYDHRGQLPPLQEVTGKQSYSGWTSNAGNARFIARSPQLGCHENKTKGQKREK